MADRRTCNVLPNVVDVVRGKASIREGCGQRAVAEYRQPYSTGERNIVVCLPVCSEHDDGAADRFRSDLPLERRKFPDGDWTTVERSPDPPVGPSMSGTDTE